MFQYKNAGLDYVYLKNGFKLHETEYGSGYSIKEGDALDEALAAILVTGGYRLGGQEVRFLRSLLHWSQKQLADEIGAQRVTIARWEAKPHTPIPGAQDRAIRICVAREMFPEHLQVVANTFSEIEGKRPSDQHIVMSLQPKKRPPAEMTPVKRWAAQG